MWPGAAPKGCWCHLGNGRNSLDALDTRGSLIPPTPGAIGLDGNLVDTRNPPGAIGHFRGVSRHAVMTVIDQGPGRT